MRHVSSPRGDELGNEAKFVAQPRQTLLQLLSLPAARITGRVVHPPVMTPVLLEFVFFSPSSSFLLIKCAAKIRRLLSENKKQHEPQCHYILQCLLVSFKKMPPLLGTCWSKNYFFDLNFSPEGGAVCGLKQQWHIRIFFSDCHYHAAVSKFYINITTAFRKTCTIGCSSFFNHEMLLILPSWAFKHYVLMWNLLDWLALKLDTYFLLILTPPAVQLNSDIR